MTEEMLLLMLRKAKYSCGEDVPCPFCQLAKLRKKRDKSRLIPFCWYCDLNHFDAREAICVSFGRAKLLELETKFHKSEGAKKDKE